MIIKAGLTYKNTFEGLPDDISIELDIPNVDWNAAVDERLAIYGLLRPQFDAGPYYGNSGGRDYIPPQEERSCETCLKRKCQIVYGGTACKWDDDHPGYEPTPQAPEDALAKARAIYENSMHDEQDLVDEYESAIAEEQAQTKRTATDLTLMIGKYEDMRQQRDEALRRLEEAETRCRVSEADRNHEIERREAAERKLANSFSSIDMYSFAVFCNANPTLSTVKDWLAARMETKKEKH
jgi:hypothetical protein